MRHYDRTEYCHLDDAQRYRDNEYRADDEWVGPNEHIPEVPRAQVKRAPSARPSPPPLSPIARRLRRARLILSRWLDALRTLLG